MELAKKHNNVAPAHGRHLMRFSLHILLAALLCAVVTPVAAFFLIISVGVATGYSMDFGWTMLCVFLFMMLLASAPLLAKK